MALLESNLTNFFGELDAPPKQKNIKMSVDLKTGTVALGVSFNSTILYSLIAVVLVLILVLISMW
jgi:hypothetical protein